jgi:hypothetical protein
MWRLFLVLSAMLITNISAIAGEPGQPRYDCPTLYHTWQPTHGLGRFDWERINPSRHPTSLNSIKVEKESATMTWGDGKKIVFKRKYKPLEQTDYAFAGVSKNKSYLEVVVETKYRDDRPDDECRAYIAYEKPNGVDIRYLAISIE